MQQESKNKTDPGKFLKLPKNKRILSIPQVPISLNQQERMHWSKWHKIKEAWIQDIFYLLKEHGQTKIPSNLEHIKITKIKIYFDCIRTRDESNYEPMIIKPLLDALIYGKIIANDTAQYVTRPAGPVEIEIDRGRPRTEVTLEW